jgi:hypothetical protein
MSAPLSISAVTLVPGERFFLKEVTLDPAVGTAAQVELALEESSPFPLAQLYHGFVASPDGKLALAFAAYRRRFTAEDLAEWPAAPAVVPEFLALLGPPPAEPLVVLQVNAGGLVGVAWDGRASLPVAVMCKSLPDPTETQQAEMTSQLRRLAGPGEIAVRKLAGPAGVGLDESGGAVFRIEEQEMARFTAAALAEADVRDKAFLEEKRREDSRRRGWTWGLVAAVAALLLAVGLEISAGALGVWNQRRRAAVAGQAEEVRRIETAQTLATRIEDLSARQEKPFEWLSVVSAVRPRSIQFVQMESNNDRSLTINAQTTDAAAVGAYEAALRQREELEQVETRDLRSREGLTSFVLAVKFKPQAGSPATQGGVP